MPFDRDRVITHRPVNQYARWIAKRIPFVFSRWGDGEWSAVLDKGVANTDKQAYTPALRAELRAVLEDRPPYLLGLQPLAVRLLGSEIAAWLEAHNWWPAWENADVWHQASKRGELSCIVKALRDRRVILIGPPRLRRLGRQIPYIDFVEIPARGAYEAIADIRARLAAALAPLEPGAVVALSAGMCANLLIHDYCARTPVRVGPARTTWIDFGAVWEPYVGVANRTYHAAILERLGKAKGR